MTDKSPSSPSVEHSLVDDENSREDEEIPTWLDGIFEKAETIPGMAGRLPLWIPTLGAAWRAGRSGLVLSKRLRAGLGGDETLEWPDELAAEFITTLGEVFDVLPSLDDALPMVSDVLNLGGEFVESTSARPVVVKAVGHLEVVGSRVARSLLDVAFFAPEAAHPERRARNLQELFSRLEDIFDRTLQIWLDPSPTPGTDS